MLFNCGRFQTSGPWTSCSWRSSTMNACCPTSAPCRRTGVLRTSPPHHPAVRQYSVLLLFLFLSRSVCVCRGPVEREGEPRRRFRLPVVRRHQPETHGDAEAHLQDTPQVQKHIHAAPIPETAAFRETERVCKCQLDGLSVSFNFYSCLIFRVQAMLKVGKIL